MGRIVIKIKKQVDDSGVDWESMGVTQPKGKKPLNVTRKMFIHPTDIEYLEEFSETETLVKLTSQEAPLLAVADFDMLMQLINVAEVN